MALLSYFTMSYRFWGRSRGDAGQASDCQAPSVPSPQVRMSLLRQPFSRRPQESQTALALTCLRSEVVKLWWEHVNDFSWLHRSEIPREPQLIDKVYKPPDVAGSPSIGGP